MGRPIPTHIEFKDYIKAIVKIGKIKFGECVVINGKGSARRFEIFTPKSGRVPEKMWVAHEDKTVWSEDLKKALFNLGVTKKQFQEIVDS